MPEQPETTPAEPIVKTWLVAIVDTTSQRDHAAQINLISKNVSLAGVPGFESIGFDDGSNQCQHEFQNGVISNIQYQGLIMRAATDSRSMFVTQETIVAKDHTQNQPGIEPLLAVENNGVWRLTQQCVLGEKETAQYLGL